ncbi:hypothetical protein D3C85_706010 [compost metagenome]
MVLEPAFGGLQLAGRIIAANQSVETCQMTVVAALERGAQHFFGLDLSPQLPQLLGIRQHQLRLLTLCRSQLLPGTFERLLPHRSVFFPLRRQGQVRPPGPTLQLGELRRRQDFVLAQLRQQANHCRPVTTLLKQALQLTQGLCVMRMAFTHGLQGGQGACGITAIGL